MTVWVRRLGAVACGRRLRGVLSIGMVLGLTVAGTLALWSSTVTTQSGTFTTASLSILADGVKADSFVFTPGGILPGQSASAVVAVSNSGTTAFAYSATVRSDNALGQAVKFSATAGAASVNGECGAGTSLIRNAGVGAMPTSIFTGRGPIAAGSGVDKLCLQVSLPIDAPAALVGTSGSVVVDFTATAGT